MFLRHLKIHSVDNPFQNFVMVGLCTSVMLALLAPAFISAASFDCTKAKTKQEFMICNNERISQLDDSLAMVFSEFVSIASNPDACKVQQRVWIKTVRDSCTTAECMKAIMQQRLQTLRDTVATFKKYAGPLNEVVKWKWVKNTWKEEYPQLLNPSKSGAIDGINNNIAEKFTSDLSPEPGETSCTVTHRDAFVTCDVFGIFSLKIHTWVEDCEKQQSFTFLTFDLRIGEEIGVADLFKNWSTNFKVVAELCDSINGEDSSCNITEMMHHNGESWASGVCFTPKGLEFLVWFFPHDWFCYDGYTVPYASLVPFTSENSPLRRFVQQ